jgi:dsRNA-specific ribonuclease
MVFTAHRALRSALGIRKLTFLDPGLILEPTKRDILELRGTCKRWGVPAFSSWPLLLRALTHSSVSAWAAKKLRVPPETLSPSQLEFIGDRVIAFAIAPCRSEAMTGNAGFAVAASRMGIQDIFRCAERHQNEQSALANAYEAVAGAVYLDGGMPAAYAFVAKTLLPHAADVAGVNAHLGTYVQLMHAHLAKYHGGSVAMDIVSTASDDAFASSGAEKSILYTARVQLFEVDRNVAIEGTQLAGEGRRRTRRAPVTLSETWSKSKTGAQLDAVKQAFLIVQRLAHTGKDIDLLFCSVSALKCSIKLSVASATSFATVSDASKPSDDSVSRNPMGLRTLPVFRSGVQRNRALETIRREWRDAGPLDVGIVDACLMEGIITSTDLQKYSQPDGSTVCQALADDMILMASSLETMTTQIPSTFAIGHCFYRLFIAEAAYRKAPNGTVQELQEDMVSEGAERNDLAVAMGGLGRRGRQPPLVAQPCGKIMLFVALGLVYTRFGAGTAAAWLRGGRLRLSSQHATRQQT